MHEEQRTQPSMMTPPYVAYGAPPQPPPQHDGLAITSFVLSLCTLLIGALASIPAVITGHISRSRARREGRAPSGLALAGLIIGYIGIGITALLVVVLVAAAAARNSGSGGGSGGVSGGGGGSNGTASANQTVCGDYTAVEQTWNQGQSDGWTSSDVQAWDNASLTIGRDNANSNTAPALDNAVRTYETAASNLTGSPTATPALVSAVTAAGNGIANVCNSLS